MIKWLRVIPIVNLLAAISVIAHYYLTTMSLEHIITLVVMYMFITSVLIFNNRKVYASLEIKWSELITIISSFVMVLIMVVMAFESDLNILGILIGLIVILLSHILHKLLIL